MIAARSDIPPPESGPHPPWVTEQIIAETIEVWQPSYPERTLTRDDALTIILNGSRLGDLLQEIAR